MTSIARSGLRSLVAPSETMRMRRCRDRSGLVEHAQRRLEHAICKISMASSARGEADVEWALQHIVADAEFGPSRARTSGIGRRHVLLATFLRTECARPQERHGRVSRISIGYWTQEPRPAARSSGDISRRFAVPEDCRGTLIVVAAARQRRASTCPSHGAHDCGDLAGRHDG